MKKNGKLRCGSKSTDMHKEHHEVVIQFLSDRVGEVTVPVALDVPPSVDYESKTKFDYPLADAYFDYMLETHNETSGTL